MKRTLNILALLTLLLLVSCKKDKVVTNGYDPSFINLVDHDASFIGEWSTLTQGEYDNINFTIPEQGVSHYSNSGYDQGGYQISKDATYNNQAIYLEEAKKIQINQFPVLINDTLVLFDWVAGETKHAYSAIMILDSQTFYRLE